MMRSRQGARAWVRGSAAIGGTHVYLLRPQMLDPPGTRSKRSIDRRSDICYAVEVPRSTSIKFCFSGTGVKNPRSDVGILDFHVAKCYNARVTGWEALLCGALDLPPEL